MEHLAPLIQTLQATKRELEQELVAVDKMLSIAQPTSTPTPGHKRGLPKTDTPKTTKKYSVKPEIVTVLLERARARKDEGKSFVQEMPGSFTAAELTADSDFSLGTVRRAFQQLEEQGAVTSKAMSWKDLGLDKPQATTKVFVVNE